MRALIIEDEKRLAAALKHILEDQSFRTDAVFDGRTGMEYALCDKYDIILLDIMLPDTDGFEVVKTLRSHKLSTPVLMLSAKDSIPDQVLGLNAGADDYMTKPFSTEELVARVHALTRRSGEVVISSLTFSDLTLDLTSGDLSANGQSVHLSPKEFEVMRLLMANPGMAVSKETIFINVWGAESGAEDNNLEAYISFLRRKIRFLNASAGIKNLQKIGYRLVREEG